MAKRGPRPRFGLEQIKHAAQTIILDDGLDGMTMNRLARELGTSASALYRYYPSKEALMVALQVQAIGEIEVEVIRRLKDFETHETPEWTPRKRAIQRCMVAFDVYAEEGDTSGRGLIDAFLSEPKPFLSISQAKEVNIRLSRVLNLCVQTLEEAVRLKAIVPGDNSQRTHLIWASLHGIAQFRKRDRIQPEPLRSSALKKALYDVIFVGFGADPAL